MSISARIEAAEAELVSLKDALVEATKSLEAAPEEESLLVQVEELSDKTEKAANTVSALKKAEAALAARAVAPAAPAVVKSQHLGNQKADGNLFVKHATAAYFAHVERKPVEQVLEERYGDQDAVKASYGFISKTAVPLATTTNTGWAAELVRNDVQGFMEALAPVSVAAALAQKTQAITFGGYNSITVPRRNALNATLTEPAWVSEGGAIPLTSFSLGTTTLNRYKLAAICTMSNEVRDRSTPSIEAIIRRSLMDAAAQVLDSALLGTGAAVAGVRPAGLLVAGGFTSITATTGGSYGAVMGDIQKFLAALTAANLGARPVLIMNSVDRLSVGMMTSPMAQIMFRDELAANRLLSMEVISSTHVPKGTVIALDADGIAMAYDAPEFNVSDVATVVQTNADATPPTMAGTDATPGAVGTAGQVPPNSGIMVSGSTGASTVGYTARSLWQTYSTGVRMVMPQSWGVLRPGSVAAVTAGLTW